MTDRQAGGRGQDTPTGDRIRSRVRLGALAALVVGLSLIAWPTGYSLPAAVGISLLVCGAGPLAVAARSRSARADAALVAMAVVVALAPTAVKTLVHIQGEFDVRHRDHDGGVLVTRAAAEDVLAGRNPYVVDHRNALPEAWHVVQAPDGELFVNPVMDHYPYLPAAALVQVPFVAAGDLLGWQWDPRLLGLALLVATVVVIARRPEPPWARAAAILALASGFSILTAAWGTNDVAVACLVVLACLLADRRPWLAGALLALAVAFKLLVLLAVIPLVAVVVARRGWSGLREWWTVPAVLAATTLPFLLSSPGSLVEDTVAFNLGLTRVKMPASGIGLPVLYPSVFQGPVLVAATLAFAAAAVVVPWRLARRVPNLLMVPVATAVGLWFLLWPARTFQETYLALIVTMIAPLWLLLGDRSPFVETSEPERSAAT